MGGVVLFPSAFSVFFFFFFPHLSISLSLSQVDSNLSTHPTLWINHKQPPHHQQWTSYTLNGIIHMELPIIRTWSQQQEV